MVSLQHRFPFPFEETHHIYSNNLKPLESACCIQVTDQYVLEVAERRRLLFNHPDRCFRATLDTLSAQWEVLDAVIHQLVNHYPECFELQKHGDEWIFRNILLNETERFTFGDESTLATQPLNWIGRQVQEDLILMVQRDDELYLDAGQLSFPSVWSLTFDFGMSFREIHRPVPWSEELGDKIRRFLLRVEVGRPWTRLNWAMQVGRRLDISPETFADWGAARYQLTQENLAKEVHLRVEEQCILRLPGSNALLFTIHTYLKSLEELSENPEWILTLHAVLTTLSEQVAEYKGLTVYRQDVIQRLESYL